MICHFGMRFYIVFNSCGGSEPPKYLNLQLSFVSLNTPFTGQELMVELKIIRAYSQSAIFFVYKSYATLSHKIIRFVFWMITSSRIFCLLTGVNDNVPKISQLNYKHTEYKCQTFITQSSWNFLPCIALWNKRNVHNQLSNLHTLTM